MQLTKKAEISTDVKSESNNVNWKEFVYLQHLTNNNDLKICLKAHRDLEKLINELVHAGILSRSLHGCYSVIQNGKRYSHVRVDPHVNAEFYTFTRREYAEEYIEKARSRIKGKLLIYQWPNV